MKRIRILVKFLDSINEWVGKIGSWSVILIMLLTVFEVISRRVFNAPTGWTFETITMLFGFHFMIVAGYALLYKSLVSVDLLYNRYSIKTKALLSLITYALFFLPFILGIFIQGIDYTISSYELQERSTSTFAPLLYPFKAIIPIAFLLLAIQGVSEIIKQVVLFTKGEELWSK